VELKLAVSPTLLVCVEGSIVSDKKATESFKFWLECERLSSDELAKASADQAESTMAFFSRVARGWEGQKLVLVSDGTPAPFSAEALGCMFSIAGIANLCWQSYCRQIVVQPA
jgi:hypothetical protein